MKISIDIRADKDFINKVKILILQNINEILHSEYNIKKYIEGLVEKLTIREGKKSFENVIIKIIEKERFSMDMEDFLYTNFNGFVKSMVEKAVDKEREKNIEDFIIKQITKQLYIKMKKLIT